MEGSRYRNHHLLRASILPVGYPDFIEIEHQIDRTTLYLLVHTAYSLIKKHSWNLDTRLVLLRAFLLDQFRRMT
jgi:hypothetical protein